MRRRAKIIHGGGRASRLNCEIEDALREGAGADARDADSILVEITRARRGGEYVWRILPDGEPSFDERRVRREAQQIVDDLAASGLAAHITVRAVSDPHGGR